MAIKGMEIVSQHRIDNTPFVEGLKRSEGIALAHGKKLNNALRVDTRIAQQSIATLNSVILTLGGTTTFWVLQMGTAVVTAGKLAVSIRQVQTAANAAKTGIAAMSSVELGTSAAKFRALELSRRKIEIAGDVAGGLTAAQQVKDASITVKQRALVAGAGGAVAGTAAPSLIGSIVAAFMNPIVAGVALLTGAVAGYKYLQLRRDQTGESSAAASLIDTERTLAIKTQEKNRQFQMDALRDKLDVENGMLTPGGARMNELTRAGHPFPDQVVWAEADIAEAIRKKAAHAEAEEIFKRIQRQNKAFDDIMRAYDEEAELRKVQNDHLDSMNRIQEDNETRSMAQQLAIQAGLAQPSTFEQDPTRRRLMKLGEEIGGSGNTESEVGFGISSRLSSSFAGRQAGDGSVIGEQREAVKVLNELLEQAKKSAAADETIARVLAGAGTQ